MKNVFKTNAEKGLTSVTNKLCASSSAFAGTVEHTYRPCRLRMAVCEQKQEEKTCLRWKARSPVQLGACCRQQHRPGPSISTSR
jgi:hypothetical protein